MRSNLISMQRFFQLTVLVLVSCCANSSLLGQENDPTAKSDVINKTLAKIRDVEQLETFVTQNNALKAENAELKKSLASMQQQLTKLTADIEQQSVQIRKQLLQMPTFQVQSKVINGEKSMALLKTKTSTLRIRSNTKMSVPVSDGIWVLMEVKEISKDMIVLSFPELERDVFLYD